MSANINVCQNAFRNVDASVRWLSRFKDKDNP